MLKTKEALVLSGGLGSRLRSVVNDRPKPMADMNGQPFLVFLLDYLYCSGLERVIICAGYKSAYIVENLNYDREGFSVEIQEEKELLGTGGAIKSALSMLKGNDFFVLNGDSFCECDFKELEATHLSRQSAITLLVAKVKNTDGFGTVTLDDKGKLVGFQEKTGKSKSNLVNAGVYIFNKNVMSLFPASRRFSLEYDFFPKVLSHATGVIVDSALYDIGTPESYRFASKNLR